MKTKLKYICLSAVAGLTLSLSSCSDFMDLTPEDQYDETAVWADADLTKSTKTSMFQKEFPERHFNVGIAEADLMGTAAGFATCGKIPFASTFAMFAAGRAYILLSNLSLT